MYTTLGAVFLVAERFGVSVEYLEALPLERLAEYLAFDRVRRESEQNAERAAVRSVRKT